VTLKNILTPVPIFEVVAGNRNEGRELVDPVCQMRVDPLTAAAQLTHGGRTYHFCSPECSRAFAEQANRSGGSTWT
jgi:YHS domain-containing protein